MAYESAAWRLRAAESGEYLGRCAQERQPRRQRVSALLRPLRTAENGYFGGGALLSFLSLFGSCGGVVCGDAAGWPCGVLVPGERVITVPLRGGRYSGPFWPQPLTSAKGIANAPAAAEICIQRVM